MAVELAHHQVRDQEVIATWVARLGAGDGNGGPPTLELLQSAGPVASAVAGGRVAVFDGVLHNRAELQQTLGEPSEQGDEASLVLKAYQRWGVALLDELKGRFALAIWDGDERRLLLARDPLGHYPIFYAEGRDELFVSTSIDAILSAGSVPRTLNRAAIADHLCHRWPDREETYFEAVKRVPACHALVVESGVPRVYRYWDPAPPGQEMEWIGEDELDRFHDLFDEAVNRCLALGPAGIFLSGGLDSVSVAGVAADNCRTRRLPEPLALSVVFPHPDCNEELAQKAVARGLGLSQVMLNLDDAVGSKGLLLSACETQIGRPAPILNYYASPYLRLAEEAKTRGCDTIITGNGGDEWLTVTPLYAADLIAAREFRALVRHVQSIRRSFDLSTPRVWSNALWRFGVKLLLMPAMGRALRATAPGLREPYHRRVVRAQVPGWAVPDDDLAATLERRALAAWPDPPTDGWYRYELRKGLDHAIVALEMEENFENTRLTGTRTMAPFQDADLVDFLYRVPPDLLDRGGRAKGLVRDELARRFPTLGFERHKKISALSFARDIALEQGERAWKELGGVPALAELGIVDADAIERKVQTILSGRDDETFRIWDVLNLESWTRSRL